MSTEILIADAATAPEPMFKKILIANRGDNAAALRRSQIALRAQPAQGD